MTTREYLEQIRHLDGEINTKLETVAQLRERATNVSASSEGHSGGGDISDKVGRITAKIVDFEREINIDIDALVDMKRTVYRQIQQVDDTTMRAVLQGRYINLQTLEEIAENTGYSIAQIWRLHGKSLKMFEKMIGNERS